MVDGEPHWWYHARFLGSQYLHHDERGTPLVLPKLGSWEAIISVMVDEGSQSCYHAKVLGSQWLCHDGRGVPVVLPC